jgi:chromosome segregation ATPase
MTALQKTSIAATLFAAVGAGIYEARRASALQSQIQAGQQPQAALAEQNQQLTRERDAATRQLAALREENERLNRNSGELLRLRGEVAQLRPAQQQGQSKTAAIDPNDPDIQSFLAFRAKAKEISRYLEQMPDKKIPELKLLIDEDWMSAVRSAKFDTDADIRQTLSKLRNLAKERLPMGSALNAFLRATGGQLPTDLSQLKPYLKFGDTSVDDATLDAILERYTLLHTGNLRDIPPNAWIVVEKAPVDNDYDTVGKFGPGSSTFPKFRAGKAGVK